MNSATIRKKFTHFFKKHGHQHVESSTLWPHDDPSVLLTTAGMQQFKPYFMGVKDPIKDFAGKRLVSIQRCFRTSDIESVGDATHSTFFEMLGNFSIADYFKSESIDLAWAFMTKELKIDPSRLWVTFFKGDGAIDADIDAVSLWKKYLPAERIVGFGKSDNWWGPPGTSGPCGPCSEIHYDFTKQACEKQSACLPNCSCGRFMEVWNLVFTQYHQNEAKKLKELPTKNIDTGMGLERLALIMQKKSNIFDTDLYLPIVKAILHSENFGSINAYEDTVRSRIVADHLKGATQLLADGVTFSNKEQGYILRRIFRRALDQFIHPHFILEPIIKEIIGLYEPYNNNIKIRKSHIHEAMAIELSGYQKILETDVAQIVQKIKAQATMQQPIQHGEPSSRHLSPEEAFMLYSSYGLSRDRIKREGFVFDERAFNNSLEKHQAISKAGSASKFGGHGLQSSELAEDQKVIMTKYHTATHLLHQALRTILGNEVKQEGSDITPERLRFDFRYPEKLTDKQKTEIEDMVNEKIQKNLPVTCTEMNYEDAIQGGALAFFKEKYPPTVTVYSIGDFSKEVCGGPHVASTGEMGIFKVISEKSSSAGIRRIKSTLS